MAEEIAAIPTLDEGERDPLPSDFEGRTIRRVDTSSCNVWQFYFEDGYAIAIEAEVFGTWNIPVLQVCVSCAGDNTAKEID